ncbi:MAG: NAD(P)H-binding protein [Nonomuraea sp.]|nr:NAD(P)H-binding protein [Nonomuraea sp.]NUP67628.1 NAD(P)H-binding protein [Nonomuraea sp.]NUP76758.1 NAD(P)H-binding protein [Nonomuraea sp.]
MILITGATGAIGRPLAELLTAEGAKVRAVTRAAAGVRLPAGVEVVEGDPARPGTLAAHLDGVSAVFLHSRAIGDAAGDLLALAKARGATRVVALSAMNADDPFDEQPSRFRGDRNKEAEAAAVASGLAWTSLRAASFSGNALQAWAPQIRAGDVVRYVHAGFQEVPVDERDLVEVAARALLGDASAQGRLELTGPESLTHERMVAVIGEAIGRPLRFEEIPTEAAERRLIANGLPTPFARALMARYTRYAVHAQHGPTDDLAKALGRPGRTFATWAADHAAAFARQP